jgi:hypothetical protein
MNKLLTVDFTAKWHRLALGVFATCWATALILPLLFPDHAIARMLALTLLGIGACAVLAILINGLWACLSSREGLRDRV